MARRRKEQGVAKSKALRRKRAVVVLNVAVKEGREVLSEGQYLHIQDLVEQLVAFGTKDLDPNLRIEQIEQFWELKEKGGPLGKKNIRVYFAFEKDANEIVTLRVDKKEADGKPSRAVMLSLKTRLAAYRRGELDKNSIRHNAR